jgi:hypothetical protein
VSIIKYYEEETDEKEEATELAEESKLSRARRTL